MSASSPIERGFLREAPDGSSVFFPWGLTRRGYRLPDDRSRSRALRAVSTLVAFTTGGGVWAGHALSRAVAPGDVPGREALHALAWPLAVVALAVVGYALWVTRFVEGLPPSDLRVPRDARLREAAQLARPGRIAAIGAILVALCVLGLVLRPDAFWPLGPGVALGVGLVVWARVLRRAARDAAQPDADPRVVR